MLLMLLIPVSSYAQKYYYRAVAATIGIHVDQEEYQWSDWIEADIPIVIDVSNSIISINSQTPQKYTSKVSFYLPIFSEDIYVYPTIDRAGKSANVLLYRDEDNVKSICIHYNDVGFAYQLEACIQY